MYISCFIKRITAVKSILHLFYLKLPFVKKFVISYQSALISQLLSTLFKSGLSINESLEITSEAATNVRYQDSIKAIKNRVSKGTTLSAAMAGYPDLYPSNMINIVSTGEKSGTLDNSFTYLSEFYSKEVRNKTKKLPTTIEPILLCRLSTKNSMKIFQM